MDTREKTLQANNSRGANDPGNNRHSLTSLRHTLLSTQTVVGCEITNHHLCIHCNYVSALRILQPTVLHAAYDNKHLTVMSKSYTENCL
jgi:hypothetical protein